MLTTRRKFLETSATAASLGFYSPRSLAGNATSTATTTGIVTSTFKPLIPLTEKWLGLFWNLDKFGVEHNLDNLGIVPFSETWLRANNGNTDNEKMHNANDFCFSFLQKLIAIEKDYPEFLTGERIGYRALIQNLWPNFSETSRFNENIPHKEIEGASKEHHNFIAHHPLFEKDFREFCRNFRGDPKDKWLQRHSMESIFCSIYNERFRKFKMRLYSMNTSARNVERRKSDEIIGFDAINNAFKSGLESLRENTWFQMKERIFHLEEKLRRDPTNSNLQRRLEEEKDQVIELERNHFNKARESKKSNMAKKEEIEPTYNYQVQLKAFNPDRGNYDLFIFR